MICLLSQVMTSYHENTTKQPIECWMLTTYRAKTHRHNDKRINGFLKDKRVKHFLSNLNNNANETSASWYDVMHDDAFRRIAILKRSLNFFFLAFCDVIYQNLLHRRVYTAVSSQKLLFRQFCEKPLRITFKLMSWCVFSILWVFNLFVTKRVWALMVGWDVRETVVFSLLCSDRFMYVSRCAWQHVYTAYKYHYLPRSYSTKHGRDYWIQFVSVSACVRLSLCPHSHGRISWSIFTKSGTEATTPEVRTSLLGSASHQPFPYFAPKIPIFNERFQA